LIGEGRLAASMRLSLYLLVLRSFAGRTGGVAHVLLHRGGPLVTGWTFMQGLESVRLLLVSLA